MLQVSPSADFAGFGRLDLDGVRGSEGPSLSGCGRLRSCSLYNLEVTGANDSDRNFVARPRSRSFYVTEDDHSSEDSVKAVWKEKRAQTRLGFKRSRTDTRKHRSKNHTGLHLGSRSSQRSVPMLTISEPDSWEIISSSSGMKYGQYVDWQKIDPESAARYQKILSSDQAQLKEMGRSGFWVTLHTLRAKAYHHIINRIQRQTITLDADAYHNLSGQLFDQDECRKSTFPFPKFVEDGEIPRYCLNKSGLNSAKKILLCLSRHFPEITYCPILPALVSLLLHYSEDEAQCFHAISALVSYAEPEKRYVNRTFLTAHASCMTFGDLANKYCRGIRKLIASSRQSLFQFYSDWIMWIFADLPFSYAIRVLDVYLVEGYKVLYRVALALLSLYKVSVSSRLAHVDDFRQDMKRFVENVARHSSVDALLQTAFSIQLPTRRELNFLYHANKRALMQRGILDKSSYQSVELGHFCSSVVSETEMMVVWAWIPERYALFNPVRLFSTTDHGRSLASFYSRVDGHEPTVLLLKTVEEEVCGAFLSSDWTQRNREGSGLRFFGSEECFVFTLRPGMERYQRTVLHISGTSGSSQIQQTSSSVSSSSSSRVVMGVADSGSSAQDLNPAEEHHTSTPRFMIGDDERLLIGGDGGHAFILSSDLTCGQSECCETFESPVLCKGHFRIYSLEVWGVQHTQV